ANRLQGSFAVEDRPRGGVRGRGVGQSRVPARCVLLMALLLTTLCGGGGTMLCVRAHSDTGLISITTPRPMLSSAQARTRLSLRQAMPVIVNNEPAPRAVVRRRGTVRRVHYAAGTRTCT